MTSADLATLRALAAGNPADQLIVSRGAVQAVVAAIEAMHGVAGRACDAIDRLAGIAKP